MGSDRLLICKPTIQHLYHTQGEDQKYCSKLSCLCR